jgi:hypothetical protein
MLGAGPDPPGAGAHSIILHVFAAEASFVRGASPHGDVVRFMSGEQKERASILRERDLLAAADSGQRPPVRCCTGRPRRVGGYLK